MSGRPQTTRPLRAWSLWGKFQVTEGEQRTLQCPGHAPIRRDQGQELTESFCL